MLELGPVILALMLLSCIIYVLINIHYLSSRELHTKTCTLRLHLVGGGPKDDGPKNNGQIPEILLVEDSAKEVSKDEVTFLSSDWIRCGKHWSDTIPPHVVRARNAAQQIPSGVNNAVLPQPDDTISAVLQRHLYLCGESLNPTATYSNNIPTVLIHDAATQIETAVDLLWASATSAMALKRTFDDAWLSGAQSIQLSLDPAQRYPLWVEHLLADMFTSRARQQNLHVCSKWLLDRATECRASAALAIECQESWEVLPWMGLVPGSSPAVRLSMTDLSIFLSTKWLSDKMINAGLDYILRDMQKRSSFMLVNSLFINSLHGMHHRDAYRSSQNSQLDHAIRNQEVDHVHIPTHVNNSHWTLLSLDLAELTYSYSDSLRSNAQVPANILTLVHWWLGQLRPDFDELKLTKAAAQYIMPRQDDGFSCGVVVLSTLAHYLLDYEPWTPKTEGLHRMQWFLRLSQGLQDISENYDDSESRSVCVPNIPPVLNTLLHPELQLDNVEYIFDVGDELLTTKSGNQEPSLITRKRVLSSSQAHTLTKKLKKSKPVNTRHVVEDPRASQTTIHKIDVHAQFDSVNTLYVCCSSCMDWKRMRKQHDIKNFQLHRATNKCKRNQKTGSTVTLHSYFSRKDLHSSASTIPLTSFQVPCPGLCKELNSDIAKYLCCTGVPGGGAPSLSKIAATFYGEKNARWSTLSLTQKKAVQQQEYSLYRWRNLRHIGTVFSSECLLNTTVSTLSDEPPPCSACQELLRLRGFQVQLQRPMPAEKNLKFVPKMYRDEDVGALYLQYHGLRALSGKDNGKSPWLKFACGVVNGVYASSNIIR
ncbi:hypothetical protein BC835DRAFT_1424926 [Cytidiella melzeri]|nr:hypothetical protein BC835DRAFT_1424926 [Cytidiella melzeri]